MLAKRSDETTSSDGTDELFEDAVDTLHQIGDAASPSQAQGTAENALKCPPLGPPPPLPIHLISSENPQMFEPQKFGPQMSKLGSMEKQYNGQNQQQQQQVVVLPSSPNSPLPPPLPPRRPLLNSNNDQHHHHHCHVVVSSLASPSPPLLTQQVQLHMTPEQSISVSFTEHLNNTPAADSSSPTAAEMVDNNVTAGTSTAALSKATESKIVSSADQQQQHQQQPQFGRQRGHAKTNSLDRGLSLAKSMKTGPFPPPVACPNSNNSLARRASPIEALPILDEQDQSASTVIQSVIQQVLSENNSLVDENGDTDGQTEKEKTKKNKKKQNGNVAHEQREEMDEDDVTERGTNPSMNNNNNNSNNDVVVHYENLVDSSAAAATPSPCPPQPCHGQQQQQSGTSPIRHKFTANITTNNGTSPKHISSRSSQSEVLSIITKKQQQQQKMLQLSDNKKFHRRSASDRSPAKLDKTPQQQFKGHNKPTHQKSSTWESHQAQQKQQNNRFLLDMLDPITRDVERRMSLKAKEAEAKAAKSNDSFDLHSSDANNDSADDDDDVFGSHQHRHTGLDHVRRFARSYGVGAADFFRGAVRKAKQIPDHLTTKIVSMSRTAKKSEIIAGENEDGASSIADSDIDQLSIAAAASEPNDGTAPAAAAAMTPSASVGSRKWRFGSAEPPRGNTPSVSAPTTSAAATSSSQGQGMGLSAADASSTSAPFARTGVCRPKNAKNGPFDFENLALVQEMNNEHTGAVWCVKFSDCGRLLATAGQDRNVRVWVLHSQLKHFAVSLDSVSNAPCSSSSPSPVPSSSASSSFASSAHAADVPLSKNDNDKDQQQSVNDGNDNNITTSQSNQSSPSKLSSALTVFAPKPLCVFRGHTADVLDLSWSPRNYFLLSSGMDRTAKLWHLHRNECLCSFQHIDFVTCLAFLPKDDRYFISGSLDGKIRLWHIPEKKVVIWNEVEQVNKFITAMTFVKNGKFVVIGTFLGRCFFYSTDQLKYHTVIDVRSSRGKNSVGHKITSLAVHWDKLLVASDDSRIRIYDLRDMDLCCKFKGAQISQSLIRAAFSSDGSHVISGSEDAHIYLWRTGNLPSSLGVRKDRNHAWERIRAHQSAVITAVFAPKPQLILKWLADQQKQRKLCSSSPAAPSLFHLPPNHPTTAAAPSVVALPPQHNSSVGSTCASLMTLFPNISLSSAAPNQHIGEGNAAAAVTNGSGHIANSRKVPGDVVVSADLSGSLKVFVSQ